MFWEYVESQKYTCSQGFVVSLSKYIHNSMLPFVKKWDFHFRKLHPHGHQHTTLTCEVLDASVKHLTVYKVRPNQFDSTVKALRQYIQYYDGYNGYIPLKSVFTNLMSMEDMVVPSNAIIVKKVVFGSLEVLMDNLLIRVNIKHRLYRCLITKK